MTVAVAGNIFEPGRRHPDGSYVHVYRKLGVRTPLPMTRAVLVGPRWRRLLMTYRTNTGRMAHHPRIYDFTDDVRELVSSAFASTSAAMWTDPRELLR
jgi:hypothetical protein